MENMQTFIIGLVVVSVTLVIGIYIVSTIQGTLPANSAAANAAGDITTSLADGTPWITILVVVGFAVIVLGMLTSGFGRAASGSPVY
jgi:uncharacterized membrane protein